MYSNDYDEGSLEITREPWWDHDFIKDILSLSLYRRPCVRPARNVCKNDSHEQANMRHNDGTQLNMTCYPLIAGCVRIMGMTLDILMLDGRFESVCAISDGSQMGSCCLLANQGPVIGYMSVSTVK